MNEERFSVLVDKSYKGAQELGERLTQCGAAVSFVGGSPLRIQNEALRLNPTALILSNLTRHSSELCALLKSQDDPPFIAVISQSDGSAVTKDYTDLILDHKDPGISEKLCSRLFDPMSQQTSFPCCALPEKLIADTLFRLCMTKNYQGYRLTLEAIKLAAASFGLNRCISKDIYPAVAKKYCVSPCSVERNIRTAIHSAWTKAGASVKREYFGTFAHDERWIPTNSQFIYIIADRLSLACDECV